MPQNFWTKFRNSGHSVVASLVAWMISSPYKKCRGYPNCTSLMLCSTIPLKLRVMTSKTILIELYSWGTFHSFLWWVFFDRKIRSRLSLNICPIASKNNFQFIKTCYYSFLSCCPQVHLSEASGATRFKKVIKHFLPFMA